MHQWPPNTCNLWAHVSPASAYSCCCCSSITRNKLVIPGAPEGITIESPWLEKTARVTQSAYHQYNPTKPCPSVQLVNISWTVPGMVTPPPPWAACTSASPLIWRRNFSYYPIWDVTEEAGGLAWGPFSLSQRHERLWSCGISSLALLRSYKMEQTDASPVFYFSTGLYSDLLFIPGSRVMAGALDRNCREK